VHNLTSLFPLPYVTWWYRNLLWLPITQRQFIMITYNKLQSRPEIQWIAVTPVTVSHNNFRHLSQTFSYFYGQGDRCRTNAVAEIIHDVCSIYMLIYFCHIILPLWSSGQSSWLQIQRSQVRFPELPDFLRSSGSGTGSTQAREYKWGATWKK
jgi:hypothetical protein